jgi:hypothetical protein
MNLRLLGVSIALFASLASAQNTTTGSLLTNSGGITVGGSQVQQSVGGKYLYLWGGGSDGLNYTGGNLGAAIAFNGTNYIVGTDGGSNGGFMLRSTSNGDSVGFYIVPNTGGTVQTISPSNIESYRRMTIAPNGWVGIGTTNPGALLEVNGNIKFTSGSNGTITFGDGTVQTTAIAATQAGGTSIAGLVFNNLYVTSSSTAHAYKLATLAANNLGSYDHLHLFVTLNPNWGSTSNSYIDARFSNRNGFAYTYTVSGAPVVAGARLGAYQNTAGGVDIYVQTNGQNIYTSASYTIIENQQETVYPNPTDAGSSIPGTLVFDSSSATYPPATYIDGSNNLNLAGNITLAAGKGASITYQDGTTQGTAWTGVLQGGDYAESVDVSGDRAQYAPGDVLVVDRKAEGRFLKSSQPYSTAVMGIYSTRPGVVGRRQKSDRSHMAEEVPMAMIGVVPTKVTAEGGPIKPGDLLVTSSKPGYAMKGSDHSQMMGAIIGKALGHLDSGTGLIEVAVSLQ